MHKCFGVLIGVAAVLGLGVSVMPAHGQERPDRPPIRWDDPRTPRLPGDQDGGASSQQIHFGRSDDCTTFAENSSPIMRKGGAPALVELTQDLPVSGGPGTKKGDLVVYLVDGRSSDKDPRPKLARIFSSDDGKNWSGARNVVMHWPGGQSKGTPMNPTVVQIEDGRLRMYYWLKGASTGVGPGGPQRPRFPNPPGRRNGVGAIGASGGEVQPGSPYRRPDRPDTNPGDALRVHAIGSATSDDGINFTPEDGYRLELEGVTDPEVMWHRDFWYMALGRADGEIVLARSADGMKFDHDPDFRISQGGAPGLAPLDDERLRIYRGDPDGVGSIVYNVKTGKMETDAGVRADREGASPSVLKREGGGCLMVFTRPMGKNGR